MTLEARLSPLPLKSEAGLGITEVAGVRVEGSESLRFDGARNAFLHPSALTTAAVRFGRLSQDEFATLKEAFGGRSEVAFDPQRAYEVLDFLPPGLQAIVNLDLDVQEPAVLKGSSHWWEGNGPQPINLKVDLTANCHATAWEAMRAFQGNSRSWSVFYGDPLRLDELTANGRRFDKVAEFGLGEADRLMTADLKPGDLVQFHEVIDWQRMTLLLHSAVYVGGGLFVDKPNTEYVDEDSPVRLATLESMVAPIAAAVEGRFRTTVLRAKDAIPEAAVAFASGFEKEAARLERRKRKPIGTPLLTQLEFGLGGGIRSMGLTGLQEFPVQRDESGRGVLVSPERTPESLERLEVP